MSDVEEMVVQIVDGKIGPFSLEPGRHYRFVVRRPRLTRVDLSPLCFAPDSALLVPSSHTGGAHPVGAIMTAVGHLGANADARLVVVGHASADDTASPGALSQDRADGVVALLRDEPDPWVEIAKRSGSLADVIAYLNYLAYDRHWPCYAGEPRKDENDESRAGVAAFQKEYNSRFGASLDIDGVCGEDTLGAVFAVLRDELNRWMEKHSLDPSAIRLHEEVPTLAAGRDHVDSPQLPLPNEPRFRRVVDLVLVDPTELEGKTPSLETLYVETDPLYAMLPVEDEPGAWEYGEVVAFLPAADPARATVRYQLKSTDGTYDRTLSAADDGKQIDDHVEMVFDWVPTSAQLTMLVHDGADTHVLYEAIPYDELEKIEPLEVEDLLDPVLIWKEEPE